ncbi:MAG: 50S ribosomal protein L24 [Oscillospiraceae bacterium]|jgi:large subunit ribosomal protein L24|nr:50S ribosomal protein L24 [Oscillospiraceae bacterium]
MIKKNTKAKKIHVKTGDTVLVVCGKDKGRRGEVLAVSPKEGKIMVRGINLVSKHVKPRRENDEGGIIRTEAALYSCKVQLVCSHCDRPTRIAHAFFGENHDEKQRVCKKCNNIV